VFVLDACREEGSGPARSENSFMYSAPQDLSANARSTLI
jgi:hypothetical protein